MLHCQRRSTSIFGRCSTAPPPLAPLVLAFLLLHPLPVSGQEENCVKNLSPMLGSDMSTIASQMRTMTACINQRWLESILGELSKRSAHNPERLALLTDVRLEPIGPSRPHSGPNAVAEYRNGVRLIYVDFMLMVETFTTSDLAGLFLTRPPDDLIQPMGFELGLDAAREYERAATAGYPPPPISFSLDDYISDPIRRTFAEALGSEAVATALAWIVLHEVAHHELGHLEVPEPPPSTARAMELEADSAAFAALLELGYGLAPLHAFISARAVLEGLRDAMPHLAGGQSPPTTPADLSHPSFATRLAQLERWDISSPPVGDYIIVSAVFLEADGRPTVEVTLVPEPSRSDLPFAYHGEGPGGLPYEWIRGEAHLYGRSPGLLSRITVHDPDSLYPRLSVRLTDMTTGAAYDTETLGFRVGFAQFAAESIGPILVSQVFELTPNQMFRQQIEMLDVSGTAASEADLAFSRSMREMREILLLYAKGEIGEGETTSRMAAMRARMQADLETILGPQKYQQFLANWTSDPLIGWALERAQGQLGP